MEHSPSFEDAQISASTMANPCPHVNFHWMLGLGFVLRFLSFHITACPSVHFNLHCGFVHVYDILEAQTLVFACPCQSFFFISYHLTVTQLLRSPT